VLLEEVLCANKVSLQVGQRTAKSDRDKPPPSVSINMMLPADRHRPLLTTRLMQLTRDLTGRREQQSNPCEPTLWAGNVTAATNPK
jgi:hypothetical protein